MILLSGNGELENAPEEPNIFNVGSIRIPSPAADLHSTGLDCFHSSSVNLLRSSNRSCLAVY